MAKGVLPYSNVPAIHAPTKSVRDVHRLLNKNVQDKPAHDFAVVKAYVDAKYARGHMPGYVTSKLDRLEETAPPTSGQAFVLVRDFFGYTPSKLFTASVPPVISVTEEAPPPAYHAVPAPPVVEVSPPVPPPPSQVQAPAPPAPARAPQPTASSSTHARSASHRLSSALTSLKLSKADTLAAPPSPIDRSGASSPASIVVNGEHALEMLRDFDTAFVVDDSSSMRMDGRWEQACSAVRGVVGQACKYDDDGVDVYFLNAKRDREGVRRPADVDRLFRGLRPNGTTPTGRTLEKILRDYMRRLEAATAEGRDDAVKPLNIIVITDGAPTDDPESVIVAYAKRLDKGDYPLSQVGIQFFQVGDDPAATAALQELDDELGEAHGIRDMVDTVPYAGELTPEAIVKVLLGGVNRRLDRRGRV